MSEVFADTAYWIASLAPDDKYHDAAITAMRAIESGCQVVTSQMVLTEVLNDFAGRGRYLRGLAVSLVEHLVAQADVTVVHQSDDWFARTLTLYRDRPDKSWSFTDCSSMLICKALGIADVLTADRHFVQAGFNALMRNE